MTGASRGPLSKSSMSSTGVLARVPVRVSFAAGLRTVSMMVMPGLPLAPHSEHALDGGRGLHSREMGRESGRQVDLQLRGPALGIEQGRIGDRELVAGDVVAPR